jgi:hypothetical protein
MGRGSCSIQLYQKPVEAVAYFELEVSHSMKSIFEVTENNMTKNRLIRSIRVSSSKTKVNVMVNVKSVIAAVSLAMIVIGIPSA